MNEDAVKNISNNEQKEFEKRKFLLNLENEITQLENRIKFYKLYDFKNYCLRNFKIFGKLIQAVYPYVLSASILAECFKIIGFGLPFYKDDIRCYPKVMKKIDNLGNKEEVQKYYDYDDKVGVITYYSKWNKDNNGKYNRIIKKYYLKEVNENDIMEFFYGDLPLSSILKKEFFSEKLISDELSLKQMNEDDFYEAIIYNENKDEFIVVKESTFKNILVSVLYIYLTEVIGLISDIARKKNSNFDFKESIYYINNQYEFLDVKHLKKRLEIKKSNYDRLTR